MFLNLTERQILEIMLAGAALGFVLILVEYLKRHHKLEKEGARKSIHIAVGVLLALLPIFMTRRQVILTNFAFFGGVLLTAGWFKIFTAVHSVKRWTIGEFLYPIGTGLVALIWPDLRIYTTAVLVLAFSDGLAGLLGRTFGGRGYQVFGGTKTYLGNAVFFMSTVLILFGAWWVNATAGDPTAVPFMLIFGGAAFITVVEASLSGGFDNLGVPLATAVIASALI